MSIHARMACNPILKKVEGDEKVQSITPVIDAQFLIGKSWDASLRLPWPDVSEKHCTIEKVEASKWTVVSHENAIIHINNEVLTRGLPKLLQFGDLLRITSSISFYFKCSCMDCEDLSSISDVPVAKRPRFTEINYYSIPRETPEEVYSQPCFQVPNDEDLRSRCEQLFRENIQLTTRLKNAQNVAVFWETEKNKTRACYFSAVESYNDVLEKYTQLRRLKEDSDREQEKLRTTVNSQNAAIERLNLRLNQLQQDFYNAESFKHNLENRNKKLTTDNALMRFKVEKYVEYVKSLHRKNVDLQTEVTDLKKKDGFGNFTVPSLGESLNLSTITSDASSDIRNSLTDLLETEFKCSICDEVFIEAVVTNCTHIFCSYCIKSWKAIKPNCPICRSMLTKEVKVLVIDSFVTNVMPLVTENLRSNWVKIGEERKITKENNAVKSAPTGVEYSLASSSSNENAGNFHDALMNIYRHLLNFEDVIDLTI